MGSVVDLLFSVRTVKNILTRNPPQLADNARTDQQELAVLNRAIAAVFVAVGWALALVHGVVLFVCLHTISLVILFGIVISISISISGLVRHNHYGNTKEGRANMDPAHNVLYVMCVAQGALFLYRMLLMLYMKTVVNQVSLAYGFQDGDSAVSGYLVEIRRACFKNPSSVRGRNLITYAVQLMESKSPHSCLSGTLILDRLLTRQHSDKIEAPTLVQPEETPQQQLESEDRNGAPLVKSQKNQENNERKEMGGWKTKWDGTKRKWQQHRRTEEEIIVQQHRVIKQLIGSASSPHILHKLLRTLDSREPYDRKMRVAAARIVELVAGWICLEQFPQGIQCISSLVNTFEEYRRLLPHQSSSNTNNGHCQQQGSSSNTCVPPAESDSESESEPYWDRDIDFSQWPFPKTKKSRDITDPFSGYKDLVMTGLRILLRLVDNKDNCVIISNSKHLVCKIMAPISYDQVHRTNHSAWSTSVVEGSLKVMLQLVAAEGETGAKLRRKISSNRKVINIIERILSCEECKGRELQMNAMKVLTQLCMDKAQVKGDFIKMLVSMFVNGVSSDRSMRESAGKALVLFVGRTKVASIFPHVNDATEFAGGLVQIVSHDEINTCRNIAAEILEHLCIRYTGNDEYICTIRNALTGVMPKLMGEILHGFGSIGEEGRTGYARSATEVVSQVIVGDGAILEVIVCNNKKKNTSSSRQNQHHELHLALLSLCVTACETLHLDINAISLGEADQGGQEGAALRFAMKMVQLNKDVMTTKSLTVMKLTTRIVIATMKNCTVGSSSAILERAALKGILELLSSISETMLDLESCKVFATGTRTMAIPDTAEKTLDSIVKLAWKLHAAMELHGNFIAEQDSQIVPAGSS
uniref:Uncharacterized protein n=1 Tax=Aegilops tauschii TaxID=37682 RepID=M8C9B2_AEGTA